MNYQTGIHRIPSKSQIPESFLPNEELAQRLPLFFFFFWGGEISWKNAGILGCWGGERALEFRGNDGNNLGISALWEIPTHPIPGGIMNPFRKRRAQPPIPTFPPAEFPTIPRKADTSSLPTGNESGLAPNLLRTQIPNSTRKPKPSAPIPRLRLFPEPGGRAARFPGIPSTFPAGMAQPTGSRLRSRTGGNSRWIRAGFG